MKGTSSSSHERGSPVYHVLCFLVGHCCLSLSVCLSVASCLAESEPYGHSGMFVCLDVCHSATYSLPRWIDQNQIWSAGTYLSSHACKPFWIPYLPYCRCQMEKYGKFCLFPTLNGCHLDIRAQIKKADVSRCECRCRVLCPNSSKFDHKLKDE